MTKACYTAKMNRFFYLRSHVPLICFHVSVCCALLPVATVNEYALKGLDKMEENLPILHQPADKVSQKTVLQ